MSELSSQTDALDETLVAYLEGELDAESAQQLEHRLANEDKVRQRLQALAQSWDLLDHLPRAAAGETFTQTTVEMVAVAAERELVERSSAQVSRKSRRYLAVVAAVAVAAAVGFVAIALGWANPNDRLLRDLPTIENVELYRQVGDIDFLRRLGDENLFSDEAAEVARDETAPAADKASAKPAKAAVAVTPAAFDARRDFVRALDPAEKEDLNQKLDKFLSLPTDEQARLRKLDAELAADPHADRLRHVMERYYDWLKMLSTAQRADLLALGSVDRVAMIKSLTREQEARLTTLAGGFHLMRTDVDTLHRWIDDMALKHKDELLKDLPEKRQQEFKSLDERQLKQRLALMAWQRLRSGPGGPGPGFNGQGPMSNAKPLDISPAETQSLIDQLSSGARGVLAAQPTPAERVQTIRSWVQAFARVRFGGGRYGQMISQEDLDRIFKNLKPEERDRLAALPHDELNRELRRRYFEEQFKNGPKDHPGRKGDRHDEHRDDHPAPETQKTST